MTTFLHPARQLWPCPCRLSAARLLCTSEKLFLINRAVCCWTGSLGLFWLWTEQDQAVCPLPLPVETVSTSLLRAQEFEG